MNNGQTPEIDFTIDSNNLFKEESITDFKVASIRTLIPVKLDGSVDTSRKPVFYGHTQLVSPQGPVPIQAPLEAETLEEAIAVFPKAMQLAMEQLLEKYQQMHEQQQQQEQQEQKEESRIIIPGR